MRVVGALPVWLLFVSFEVQRWLYDLVVCLLP
jgi:hypothetical protein